MKPLRVRTLMLVVALVAVTLGLVDEGIVRYARGGHARFHEGRARWFAAQAGAYRGRGDGVREESLRFSEWHRKRAEAYRLSRKYDHEAEMIEDSRQAERESPVDRRLVIDRDARRSEIRGFDRVDDIKRVRKHPVSPSAG